MNAVTITGMAVKRLKKEIPLSKSGRNLGVFVSPLTSAVMAKNEHMPTNITARSTETAELNHSDSA